MDIRIKRIYNPFSESDGVRILVDRLWPRGLTKEEAHIDRWMKEVAPSTDLRKWFNHEPEKWEQFCVKYHHELEGSASFAELYSILQKNETVTLLYGAKSETYNQAVVLKQFIIDYSTSA